MIKFSREAIKQSAVGDKVENQLELMPHEKIIQKKKNIAAGYNHGWIIIGEDRPMFVRSRWEANLVFYFEFLKKSGSIKNWFYESETFWFDNIRRGTNNYKPDFKIVENNDVEYFIEVKGYFTRKDYVKMKRMAKYHPNVIIKILSDDKGFASMHKNFPTMQYQKYSSYDMISNYSGMVKGWNQPLKKKEEIQHLIPLPMKKPTKRTKPV